jgi:hypothetical protein
LTRDDVDEEHEPIFRVKISDNFKHEMSANTAMYEGIITPSQKHQLTELANSTMRKGLARLHVCSEVRSCSFGQRQRGVHVAAPQPFAAVTKTVDTAMSQHHDILINVFAKIGP